MRVIIALLLVLILSIIPLPAVINAVRPPWVLLLILYIQFFVPEIFSVLGVWLLGLCLDGLYVSTLGEHAFALLFITWFAARKKRRFLFYSILQQMLFIGLCVLLYSSLLALFDASMGYNTSLWMILITALLGLSIWPWLLRLI